MTWHTATTRYDVRGLALETTAPFEAGYSAKTRHSYDACGQLVRTQLQKNAPGDRAAWRVSEFTYDNRGRPIDTIAHGDSGAQQRSRSAYDRAGRRIAVYSGMTSSSTAGAFVTRYAYCGGNPVAFSDPTRCFTFHEEVSGGAAFLLRREQKQRRS